MINLKRLNIEELNQLSMKIIDELNSRDDDTEKKFDTKIEEVIDKGEKFHKIEEELNQLREQYYLLEDEIERVEDVLSDLDEDYEESYREYKDESR